MAKIAAFFFIFKLLLLQFAYAPAKKMRDCKGNIPFCTGFPIGARSIPVGTRFCFAKSNVLYLYFRLTRKRGWRHTLRCGRVWQQTLFRGSRTGGFCDVSYSTIAGFLSSKIRLAGKGSEGIYINRSITQMQLMQSCVWVIFCFRPPHQIIAGNTVIVSQQQNAVRADVLAVIRFIFAKRGFRDAHLNSKLLQGQFFHHS